MHIGLDYFVYNNNLCMMKKYTVVAYDFDGTITSKDTLFYNINNNLKRKNDFMQIIDVSK